MRDIQIFGAARDRSANGALLCGELERIKGFLRHGGLLIAEGFGGRMVLHHPGIRAADACPDLLDGRSLEVVLGASLEQLRGIVDVGLAATRVLEVLAPGPLIVRAGGENSDVLPLIAIPDSLDLRDICSTVGTVRAVFMFEPSGAPELGARLRGNDKGAVRARAVGVLESPVGIGASHETPAVVRIPKPGTVESVSAGAIAAARIAEASNTISQWEIGEWT